jgi:hypothetical protein
MLFFIDLNKNIEEIEEEINRVSCSPARAGLLIDKVEEFYNGIHS